MTIPTDRFYNKNKFDRMAVSLDKTLVFELDCCIICCFSSDFEIINNAYLESFT